LAKIFFKNHNISPRPGKLFSKKVKPHFDQHSVDGGLEASGARQDKRIFDHSVESVDTSLVGQLQKKYIQAGIIIKESNGFYPNIRL
jgi:hypothetical protein